VPSRAWLGKGVYIYGALAENRGLHDINRIQIGPVVSPHHQIVILLQGGFLVGMVMQQTPPSGRRTLAISRYKRPSVPEVKIGCVGRVDKI